jgi:F0F1-type ATP synthase epsilon subunit
LALTIANLEDAVCKVLNSEYAHLINIRDGEIDVDATGAEVIVQYAVFGELVFA